VKILYALVHLQPEEMDMTSMNLSSVTVTEHSEAYSRGHHSHCIQIKVLNVST
jgi:hypothetical protein